MKDDRIETQIKRLKFAQAKASSLIVMLEEQKRNGETLVSPYVSINVKNSMEALEEAHSHIAS